MVPSLVLNIRVVALLPALLFFLINIPDVCFIVEQLIIMNNKLNAANDFNSLEIL